MKWCLEWINTSLHLKPIFLRCAAFKHFVSGILNLDMPAMASSTEQTIDKNMYPTSVDQTMNIALKFMQS